MLIQMNKTQWYVSVALMSAIVVVLASTPLGMIQLPVIKATTVHIPVIIGAALLGPAAGLILGAVFGLCSLYSNTSAPTLLSFAFSPFMSTSGLPGALKAIWVSVGCRMLLGLSAAWLARGLRMLRVQRVLAFGLLGLISSFLHTCLVMGSIYLLFAQQYAAVKEVALTAVWGLVMATVISSGIPEAAAAALLCAVLGGSLYRYLSRRSQGI